MAGTLDRSIVIIFYFALFGILGHAFTILLDPPTAFEENQVKNNVKIPGFTLCPYRGYKTKLDDIESFEETLIEIAKAEEKYFVDLKWSKSYKKEYEYDLSDPYVLQTVFNLTMNDVWYFAPKPQMEAPFHMVICLVLTPPYYQNPLEYWTVKVEFNFETHTTRHIIEMHEIGQSPYNFEVDQGNIQWIGNEPGKSHLTTIGQQVVTKNLKKSTWNCHEDNSNMQTNCVNNFYNKKLGCILPWLQKVDDNPMLTEVCQGKDKFNEFRNISFLIHEAKINNELEEEGCIIPNCEQRAWTMTSARTHFDETIHQNQKTKLIYTFSHNANVLVRNEIELYTVSSFLADFGGYLGLLLGESLVSYLLWATHWIKKLIQKHKQNPKKDKKSIAILKNLQQQLKTAIEPRATAWQEREILSPNNMSPQTLQSPKVEEIPSCSNIKNGCHDVAMVASLPQICARRYLQKSCK